MRRWCETVGWESPSRSWHTHNSSAPASWLTIVTRAGSESALNLRASCSTTAGRSGGAPGAQQGCSSTFKCCIDVYQCIIGPDGPTKGGSMHCDCDCDCDESCGCC